MESTTAPRVVLVKGRAGLGNRVLALMNAILYAELTGRRLVVDWRDGMYAEAGDNAFDRLFRSPMHQPGAPVPRATSVAPAPWRGQLERTGTEVDVPVRRARPVWGRLSPRTSVEIEELDRDEEVVVYWSFWEQVDRLRRHFPGRLDHYTGAPSRQILRDLLAKNLQPSPELHERIDGARRGWPDRAMLGVHVRYTDKRSRLTAILSRVAHLRTRHPELGLFLATDSNEVRRRVEELYPDVIQADQWMPSDGTPLHHANSCPDQAELAFAALVDVYLLANCDYLVVDEKSSLAHVAALLSRAHPARIYDVNIVRWLPRPIRHPLWRVFNAAVVMGRHGPRALAVWRSRRMGYLRPQRPH